MADSKGYPAINVRPGMKVASKDGAYEEIVRSVSVVVHLANGVDEVYSLNDIVRVVAAAPT